MISLKPSGFFGSFDLRFSRLGDFLFRCRFLLGFLGLEASKPYGTRFERRGELGSETVLSTYG